MEGSDAYPPGGQQEGEAAQHREGKGRRFRVRWPQGSPSPITPWLAGLGHVLAPFLLWKERVVPSHSVGSPLCCLRKCGVASLLTST